MDVDDDEEEEEEDSSSDKSSTLLAPLTLAVLESLTLPRVQEVVISGDLRCAECQKRIHDVISRSNAEIESVVVSLSEKKIAITCKYVDKASKTQIIGRRGGRLWSSRVTLMKRMFSSSTTYLHSFM